MPKGRCRTNGVARTRSHRDVTVGFAAVEFVFFNITSEGLRKKMAMTLQVNIMVYRPTNRRRSASVCVFSVLCVRLNLTLSICARVHSALDRNHHRQQSSRSHNWI